MPVTITTIGVGATGGDDTGDSARVGGIAINANFAAIKALLDTIELGYRGQNLQVVAAYELVLTDAGKIVGMDYATANILTIPENASVAFPINTRIDVPQLGAGETTIAIEGTDTLVGDPIVLAQNGAVTLWKKSTTVWHVFGGKV
jgi:hypothetical protein